MIINNLNLIWPLVYPNKTDAVLIINADAILSSPVAPEGLQMVAFWDAQLV
jgi:hypothetical protein